PAHTSWSVQQPRRRDRVAHAERAARRAALLIARSECERRRSSGAGREEEEGWWCGLAGGGRLRRAGVIDDLHDRGVDLRAELLGMVGGDLPRVDRGLDARVGLRVQVGDEPVAALAGTLVGDLTETLTGLDLLL